MKGRGMILSARSARSARSAKNAKPSPDLRRAIGKNDEFIRQPMKRLQDVDIGPINPIVNKAGAIRGKLCSSDLGLPNQRWKRHEPIIITLTIQEIQELQILILRGLIGTIWCVFSSSGENEGRPLKSVNLSNSKNSVLVNRARSSSLNVVCCCCCCWAWSYGEGIAFKSSRYCEKLGMRRPL